MTAITPIQTATDRLATAIRMLAIDAVEAAKSGHPGAPMGMAEMALALWGTGEKGVLRHNPANPAWPNRDRFVLSNGHASMLLYAMLHLTGYDLPVEELRKFRQLHSRCPGHPELGVTPGVETTTGPLGQGLSNAVGMALAEKLLAAEFNRPGHAVVDHRTYAFVGDGCLMEGISHESCSLAGTLGLGKLTVLYDDNGISIDGHVEGWFTDDTEGRFKSYGWQVIGPVDGHDVSAVTAALAEAAVDTARPSLIRCRTVIGRGSPNKAGGHDIHGAPLGAAEIAATRQSLGWSHPPLEIPPEIARTMDARGRGERLESAWNGTLSAYRQAYPELAAELERRLSGQLPESWPTNASQAVAKAAEGGPVATRKASQDVIAILADRLPELFGGSADLTGSNLTDWPGAVRVNDLGHGRYLSYGVREFAMAGIMNGMALHGGHLPFGGGFLVFSDYARNALRMAALMKLRVVHVLTHDSIGLGEDGPTHQPIEHAASLRLIPGLDVWRPADAVETAQAWASAVEQNGPSALLLSRQALPRLERSEAQVDAIRRGGYVVSQRPSPHVVIIASGSEVALALEAQGILDAQGIQAAVVSMPCLEHFLRQPREWRDQVLPPGIPRLAVEAGHPDPWWKVVGDGDVVGLTGFGESAPAPVLFQHFGLTASAVAARAATLIHV